MKSFFIGIFLLFITIPILALTLKGKIIDAETSKPLSFVNIGIKGSGYGTASNATGSFVLNIPDEYKNGILCFSCIGYESKEVPVATLLQQGVVQMKPSVTPLDEVTVMPDSTLRSFLRKASRRISDNYTSTSSLLSGFYRGRLQDVNDENNQRFVEVLIESYKTPYTDRKDGTVKVLKTRKYISGKNFFPAVFYGGVHVAQNDMVKSRSNVLIGHKNYCYRLLGIRDFNDRKVYEIEFFPAEDSKATLFGRFYVDVENLAYIQIDREYTIKGLEKRSRIPALSNIKSESIRSSVVYDQHNGKYYLKSKHVSEVFQNSDSNRFISSLEYVTTHISTETVSNIPFNEQSSQMYTPSMEAVDYRSSDWKDYNVLALPNGMSLLDTIQGSQLLNSEAKTEVPLNQKLMKFLLNLELSYNIEWVNACSRGVNYSLTYGTLNFLKDRKEKTGTLILQTHLGYRFNNHFYAVYEHAYDDLDNDFYFKQKYLGGRFYLLLKTTGNQILLNIDGGWSWQNMGISLGEANSEESFSFGGKKIKADKVHAYTGLRQCGVKVGSGLSYQISSRYHLEMGVNYMFPIVKKDVVIMEEKSGFFLFRKTAHEELTDEGIDYRIDGISSAKSGVDTNGWSFLFGVKMMF